MPERVDDNFARLSMEAGTMRVCGLVDKNNYLVNALHINSRRIRIVCSILYMKSI